MCTDTCEQLTYAHRVYSARKLKPSFLTAPHISFVIVHLCMLISSYVKSNHAASTLSYQTKSAAVVYALQRAFGVLVWPQVWPGGPHSLCGWCMPMACGCIQLMANGHFLPRIPSGWFLLLYSRVSLR